MSNEGLVAAPLQRPIQKHRLGLRFVANHFDVVPVRTDDEGRVVVRMVFRAQTRRTVVFATRLHGRAIEGFDLPAILGREGQMKRRRVIFGLVKAQRIFTFWLTKLDPRRWVAPPRQ